METADVQATVTLSLHSGFWQMIHIHNIWKKFGEKQVLRGISFDVVNKETTVVLGRSGGGKSVLLKMIIGLIKPDSGSIEVDGKDVTRMNYKELRALRFKFGFLFQGAALFDSMTVGENIALSLRRHTGWTKKKSRRAFGMLCTLSVSIMLKMLCRLHSAAG